MSEWVNPYIAGAPVTEPRMFFGREDVFDWIERSLTGRYVDHILLILGVGELGRAVFQQLIGANPRAQIVLVDTRPGILAELGLGPNVCQVSEAFYLTLVLF